MLIVPEDFQQSVVNNVIRMGHSCDIPSLPIIQWKDFQSCPKPTVKPNSIFRPWDDQPSQNLSVSPPLKCQTDSHQPVISPVAMKSQDSSLPQLADLHSSFELLATNVGKSSVGHICIYCGKVYSRKYGLKIHLRTHTGFKPLSCKVCLRSFSDPSNLNKHSRLHSDLNSTQYQCELCGKLMIRKRDLERHMQTRHSDDFVDVEEKLQIIHELVKELLNSTNQVEKKMESFADHLIQLEKRLETLESRMDDQPIVQCD